MLRSTPFVDAVAVPARLGRLTKRPVAAVGRRVRRASGGPARARVVVLLGAVLGLENADTSTVGAVAPQLQQGLHISHAQVGLLVSAALAVGAVATVPVGMLTDRVRRTTMLAISIAVWSGALIAQGAAGSYGQLLLFSFALGAISATAWPAVASLTGDFFPSAERARIYGLILSGELLGTAVGFAISGNIASVLGWRAAFWALSIPGFALAALIWRALPEPARGGASRLEPGSERLVGAEEVGDAESAAAAEDGDEGPEREDELVVAEVEQENIQPREELILDRDPVSLSLWRSVRYVLRVRTNVVLIVAGAVAYFFYAGIQTFATEYVRGRFGVGQSVASLLLIAVGTGALVGVVISGRLADRLVKRGHVNGRIVVPAVAYVAAAALFVPAFLLSSLLLAAPLFFLGAGALEATNSPLDAARLDIMHSRLWGRAEGVRTLLRTGSQAAAPVLFGVVADAFGGGGGGGAFNAASATDAHGLEIAFLIMLVPLVAAGGTVLIARRTYPRDVATAVEFERRTSAD